MQFLVCDLRVEIYDLALKTGKKIVFILIDKKKVFVHFVEVLSVLCKNDIQSLHTGCPKVNPFFDACPLTLRHPVEV